MAGSAGGVSAREIGVRAFRHVVLWPLSLDGWGPLAGDPDASIGEALDAFADALEKETRAGGAWRACENHVDHFARPAAPRTDANDESGLVAETARLAHEVDAYAEMVYFHDFVQRILYEKRGAQAPMRMYRREDIRRAKIRYRPNRPDLTRTLDVSVDRLRLYLFRTGVAILAVEIAWEGTSNERLSLFELQTLLDAFRRSYPHFVFPTKRKVGGAIVPTIELPQQCVDAVWWRGADESPARDLAVTPETPLAAALRIPDLVGAKRSGDPSSATFPPIFAHFAGLLPKAFAFTGEDRDVVWRHVADERMPCMSWIALAPVGSDTATLRQVSDADWHRLCFVDRGDDGYPYDPGFMRAQEFDTRHAYDRYRHLGTRYLFSGYAFTAVGSAAPPNGWSFFEAVIQMHFRRHYFAMGLLATLEYASLLATSSRITRAVERMSTARHEPGIDAEEAFAQRMSAIERDFLQFVHRYRFTGVSTQLQPMEMFARWRDTMGLTTLYEDLHQEITTANEFLETRAARRQTQAALRQAEASTNLAVLATIGLAMGLPLAFFGMNVLVVEDLLAGTGGAPEAHAGTWRRWAWHAAAIGFGYILSLGGAYLTVRALLPAPSRQSPGQSFLLRFLGWGTTIATAATCLLFAAGILPR